MPSPSDSTLFRDALGRPLGQLRVSVTDRCNLRCRYCMPEKDYHWLPHGDLLRYEEIARLAAIFAGAGVGKVRLTGGEPLLRRDIAELVRLLAAIGRIGDLALTTNGILLAESAAALRRAGLSRITVSLDTLDPRRFRELTRQDLHERVIEGIRAAGAAGFPGLKLDTVLIRGFNDDELFPMIEFARAAGAEVRFIEYMDVGGATLWSAGQVVSRAEILARIESRYGPPAPLVRDPSAPAERFALPGGGSFGIIASVTSPFCATCDRSRLTADGVWYLCLYALHGVDLRAPLRGGASDEEIAQQLAAVWAARTDRGAEERQQARSRGPLVPLESLRRDPHLEMHTRGG
ncbi:MAG TPA: GTP 3',8-cyclase MoaA [Candidatus Dormibacteraeota bacterium]|nr:GTP 3',8-cyclase MoaA [Candidatus Dormibacteraeota bacterium]